MYATGKKKLISLSIRLCIFALSLYGSYVIGYAYAERHFFDKLFLNKSSAHGYIKDFKPPLLQQNAGSIETRIKDIRTLLALKGANVLGTESDNEKFRIAIIGDSYVYGLGVKNNERFGAVLEKKLNKIRPTKVYNLGISGDDIFHNYTKYKLAKQLLSPDLYIFGMVDNDIYVDDHNKYNDEANYTRIRSECPNPEFYVPEWWKEYASEVNADRIRSELFYPSYLGQYSNSCYLEKILSELDRNDRIFFISFAYLKKNEPQESEYYNQDGSLREIEYKDDVMNYKYKQMVEKAGFFVLPTDIEGAENDFSWEAVSEGEPHPSVSTHARYADLISTQLLSNAKWGFIPQ